MRYQCNKVYHDIIRTYNEQSFSFIFQALRACSNFDFDFAQTWNQSKHYSRKDISFEFTHILVIFSLLQLVVLLKYLLDIWYLVYMSLLCGMQSR